MGESRGGRGAERSVATSDVASAVADQLNTEDREPSEIRVQRVTDGLYAVHVVIHGEQEPESFFLPVHEGAPETGLSSPA